MAIPITKTQKSLIHVAKARLGMEEADYRALLRRAAGVDSSVRLDQVGFEAVMAEFERLGFRSTRGHISRTANACRPGMATPAQVGKIRTLWRQYTGQDNDLSLGRWLDVHFHVSHVRFLSDAAAGKCVSVLFSMVERNSVAQGAKRAIP